MKNKEWYFLFLKNTNKILIDIRCLVIIFIYKNE